MLSMRGMELKNRTFKTSALVFRNTNQSIPAASNTVLIFNAIDRDDDGYFNMAQPGRLTAPRSGTYLVAGSVKLNGNINSSGVALSLARQGSSPRGLVAFTRQYTNEINPSLFVCSSVYLERNEFVELQLYSESAVSTMPVEFGDYGRFSFSIAQI